MTRDGFDPQLKKLIMSTIDPPLIDQAVEASIRLGPPLAAELAKLGFDHVDVVGSSVMTRAAMTAHFMTKNGRPDKKHTVWLFPYLMEMGAKVVHEDQTRVILFGNYTSMPLPSLRDQLRFLNGINIDVNGTLAQGRKRYHTSDPVQFIDKIIPSLVQNWAAKQKAETGSFPKEMNLFIVSHGHTISHLLETRSSAGINDVFNNDCFYSESIYDVLQNKWITGPLNDFTLIQYPLPKEDVDRDYNGRDNIGNTKEVKSSRWMKWTQNWANFETPCNDWLHAQKPLKNVVTYLL
jgi:hypothetical protein